MVVENAQMEAHKDVLTRLYELDSVTQEFQFRVSAFFVKHPEISGISYTSAAIIMNEKDAHVRAVTIKRVAEEIKRRRNVDATGFRFVYRNVTENQVRRILHEERVKESPDISSNKKRNDEIALECPNCKKIMVYKKAPRNNVVSFRTTEKVDDAISYLARKSGMSRSILVQELIYIDRRFGSEL